MNTSLVFNVVTWRELVILRTDPTTTAGHRNYHYDTDGDDEIKFVNAFGN